MSPVEALAPSPPRGKRPSADAATALSASQQSGGLLAYCESLAGELALPNGTPAPRFGSLAAYCDSLAASVSLVASGPAQESPRNMGLADPECSASTASSWCGEPSRPSTQGAGSGVVGVDRCDQGCTRHKRRSVFTQLPRVMDVRARAHVNKSHVSGKFAADWWSGGALRSVVPVDVASVSPMAGFVHRSLRSQANTASRNSPGRWRAHKKPTAVDFDVREVERQRVGRVGFVTAGSFEHPLHGASSSQPFTASREAQAAPTSRKSSTLEPLQPRSEFEDRPTIVVWRQSQIQWLSEQEGGELPREGLVGLRPEEVSELKKSLTEALDPEAESAMNAPAALSVPPSPPATSQPESGRASKTSIFSVGSVGCGFNVGKFNALLKSRTNSKLLETAASEVSFDGGLRKLSKASGAQAFGGTKDLEDERSEASDPEVWNNERGGDMDAQAGGAPVTPSKAQLRQRRIDALSAQKKQMTKMQENQMKLFFALDNDEVNAVQAAFAQYGSDEEELLTMDALRDCVVELGLGGLTCEERREMVKLCSDFEQTEEDCKAGTFSEHTPSTLRGLQQGFGISLAPPPHGGQHGGQRPTAGPRKMLNVLRRTVLNIEVARYWSRGTSGADVGITGNDSRRSSTGNDSRRSSVAPSSPAPEPEEKHPASISVYELGLTLLPNVRAAFFQRCFEGLRKLIGDRVKGEPFRFNKDYPSKIWAGLAWRMGVDPRHFAKVADRLARATAEHRDNLKGSPSSPGTVANLSAFRNSAGGLDMGSARSFSLDIAARAVMRAFESVERARRAREREIQTETCLEESTFHEMRYVILDLFERFSYYSDRGTSGVSMQSALFLLREFGIFGRQQALRSRAELWAITELTAGSVPFNVFLRLCHSIRERRRQNNLSTVRRLFKQYDVQARGCISMADVSLVLQSFSLAPSSKEQQKEIERLFLESSRDGKQTITKADLEVLVIRVDEKLMHMNFEVWLDLAIELGLTEEELHEYWVAFSEADTEETGYLTLGQIRTALTALKRTWSNEELLDIISLVEQEAPDLGFVGQPLVTAQKQRGYATFVLSRDECFSPGAESASTQRARSPQRRPPATKTDSFEDTRGRQHGKTRGDQNVEEIYVDFSKFLRVVEKCGSEDLSPQSAEERGERRNSADASIPKKTHKLKGAIRLKQGEADWAKPRILRRALLNLKLPKDYVRVLPDGVLFKVWSEYIGSRDEVSLAIANRLGIHTARELLAYSRELGQRMQQSAQDWDGMPCLEAISASFSYRF